MQLSIASDFSSTAIDSSLADTTVSVNPALANETQYFWRVKASNVGGESDWSSTWSFTTKVQEPDIAFLLLPENNSDATTLLPEFNWSQSARANEYNYQLSADENFSSVLLDSTLSDTAIVPVEKLDNGASYSGE